MKRAAVLMSALAVILYTVSMGAQAKPNFAGKWTMEAPAGGGAPGGGGGGGGRGGRGGRGGGAISGMEVTITQDANMLTIQKTQGQNPVTLKINLDGSDSKNTITTGRGEMQQTQKATWEGNNLTITTSMDMGGNAVTTKQTLSLEGGNMVVQNYGADGSPTTKLTYKKGM